MWHWWWWACGGPGTLDHSCWECNSVSQLWKQYESSSRINNMIWYLPYDPCGSSIKQLFSNSVNCRPWHWLRRGDGWGWAGWYLTSSSQLGFAKEPTPTLRVAAEVLVWVWVTLSSRCQCEIKCGRLFFGETPRWETMIRALKEAGKRTALI